MEQIEIMPRREGSGQAGTRELLSTASPILAGLALSPVARGVLAAVATIATAPQDSEAGIFSLSGKLANKLPKLYDKGAFVFPDKTRNFEISTAGFAERLRTDPNIDNDIMNMASLPDNVVGYSSKDLGTMMKNKQQLNKVDISTESDISMNTYQGIEQSTSAFYAPPTTLFPDGTMRVRGSLTPNNMADAIAHEGTHKLDDFTDEFLSMNMRARGKYAVEYGDRIAEQRAFIGGQRANYEKAITTVGTDMTIHPMLSVAEGKVSTAPFMQYARTMHSASRAGGEPVDSLYIRQYQKLLTKEAFVLQRRLNANPKLVEEINKVVREIPEADLPWTFSKSQIDAIKAAKEKAPKKSIFSDRSNIPEYDAFYNPTKDFGTYNNVVKDTVTMSPQDYIDRVVKGFEGQGYKAEDVLQRTETRKLDSLRKAVEGGAELPHPSIKYAYTKGGEDTFGQEGWHRAVLAKELGIEEIPVSIIYNETKGY